MLGAIQRLTQPPQPAYLELGLQVQPEGFSTGLLPNGGVVTLDLSQGAIVHTSIGGEKVSFPLDGRSQAEVFSGLFSLLAQGELARSLPPGTDLFERLAQGIAVRGNRYKPLQRDPLLGSDVLRVNPQHAREYLQVIQEVYTGIARFQAHRSALKTALVVWPEDFDLSSLLFRENKIDPGQPNMNFGFAPYAKMMDYPYLYAYVYPVPSHYEPPELPEGAHWNTQGWTGALLPFDSFAAHPDRAFFVERSCMAIYDGLLPLLAG